MNESISKALVELRKNKERKFDQTVDLIVNLKNFDIKKHSVNLFLELPHKVKERKACAFLNKKSKAVDTITKEEFGSYSDKKKMKGLIRKYDFFLSAASLMPDVATTFGRFLGPVGKMPSPQLGLIRQETDTEIGEVLNKISKITRVKSKEPSLKFSIGKASMKEEDIGENIEKAYKEILKVLPRQKENIHNIMIKFTMSKPIKIQL